MAANSRLTIAMHAMCWLELAAREGRSPLTSDQVAASLASHPVLVRRVLGRLRDAGLVRVSGRGPTAAWSLVPPADEVTAFDAHRALGGETTFALHPHEPNQACPVGFGIRPVLAALYADVDAAVAAELSRHTVSGVLDRTLAEHPLP